MSRDPMELVGRLEAGDVSLKTTRAAAACIREMVGQRARLYDAVSLGFYRQQENEARERGRGMWQ